MATHKNKLPLIEKQSPSEFTIKLANSLCEREGAFRLAYQCYLNKGYIKANANQWMVQSYDSNEETAIFIVQDKEKNIAATVTLVFDGATKLTAEKIYANELHTLRSQKEKIVEISRLVVNPNYRNTKDILVLLFNYLYIYSYYVKGYSCLAIEVNPRHTAYYQALLDFKTIGAERPCPMVLNAPAILMSLPLMHSQSEVLRLSKNNSNEKKDRSLYAYFLKPNQEQLVANYLEKQATPISQEEKLYFGFSETNFGKLVCV
jgi:hypothetical protein